MDLVDNDKTQLSEQTRDIVRAVHKHTLERLRRYLQNSAWLAQRSGLVRGGNIAVPMIDRDTRQVEQFVYSAELVVYQALERRDIQTAE